jgi:pimeloyl-ACP methyl ester carboxylesterase
MIAATDRVIQLDDGARTHLTQWGDSGPILLCVHGITSSRMTWWRFAEHFAGSYRVFAYDQRGHGDSANVHGPMTLERSLRDLAEVTAAIGEPIHALIGHSWGGAVVIRGGRETAYERVIAIDPMVKVIPGTWFTEFVDDLREPFSIAPAEREPVIRAFYKTLPPIEIEGKVHAMRTMSIDPIISLGEVNGVEKGRWDLRHDLADYPKPLKLDVAGVDGVMSADDLAFARDHGGPNVTIDVFEGEGHSLQRTAFEKFAEKAAAFLK